jgi:hypothetical protein
MMITNNPQAQIDNDAQQPLDKTNLQQPTNLAITDAPFLSFLQIVKIAQHASFSIDYSVLDTSRVLLDGNDSELLNNIANDPSDSLTHFAKDDIVYRPQILQDKVPLTGYISLLNF